MARPVKYETPEEMQEKINQYFSDKSNEPFMIEDLAHFLNLSRQGLCEYGKKPLFSDIIKMAKEKVLIYTYKAGAKGEINPTMSIFHMKCGFGWVETSKVEHTGDLTIKEVKYGDDNDTV